MATTPTFASTPKIGAAVIGAPAVTSRVSFTPASTDLVLTAGINGTRIDRVDIVSADEVGGASAAANVVRLWLYNGSTLFLIYEVEVPATTPTATAKGFTYTVTFINGLILPNTWTLRATVHTRAGAQDDFHVIAHAADY